MRVKGKITDWNEPRGFGFILPLHGGERVFVHVSDLPTGSRRPSEGEFVSYTLGTDERGRPCATQIAYVVSHAKRSAGWRTAELIAGCVAAAFLGFVVLLVIIGRLWWPVVCVYIVASSAAFYAYKHDKEAARVGARRTLEWKLIVWGLIGGWPGALVARHRFHHKTRKVVFRIAFWLSVGLNIVGLAWLITP